MISGVRASLLMVACDRRAGWSGWSGWGGRAGGLAGSRIGLGLGADWGLKDGGSAWRSIEHAVGVALAVAVAVAVLRPARRVEGQTIADRAAWPAAAPPASVSIGQPSSHLDRQAHGA